MITEYRFPTPIYIKNLPNATELNQYLEQKILKWSQEDLKGIDRTNVNGWHSPTDMNHKEEYQVLTKQLFIMQEEIIIQGDTIALTYILILYFQGSIGLKLQLNQAT